MRIFPSLLATAVGGCALICMGLPARAGDEVKFQSREGRHTSLVELYTSEGCSSCPPAEAWLSNLIASPQLWTEVVPVAFHVDYWDNLGWRDRFASAQWTARQRTYAANWGGDTVYTPGFVRDGREWRQWASSSNAAPLANADKGDGVGQLTVVVKNGKNVRVVYHPFDGPAAARTVSVVLLGCDLNSKVKAGENRGRNLRHDFVALACQTKPLSADKTESVASFELPAPPEDARRLALAVWVEEPGRAGIQQATGGWLTGGSPK